MYSLTFRIRVTTPPQYGRNGTAHAAGASILSRGESSPACVVCVCGMRAACGGPGGLPLSSATHFHSVAIATQPVHRLQICPIVHNQGAYPYHSPKLHPGPCNSVGMRPRTHRQTQTDTQTRVTTIHFSWSTTHEKCNHPRAILRSGYVNSHDFRSSIICEKWRIYYQFVNRESTELRVGHLYIQQQ